MAKSTPPVKSAPPAAPAAAPNGEGGATAATAEPMSIKDVVATLVKNSKGKGQVTYDQLNALLPDAMNQPRQLEQILEQLDGKGVELDEELGGSDDSSDFAEDTGGTSEGEEGAAPTTGRYEAAEQTPEGDEVDIGEKIDDPVRMYLSQMGEIPLLTRDQ